jgi:hypothetical protein
MLPAFDTASLLSPEISRELRKSANHAARAAFQLLRKPQ